MPEFGQDRGEEIRWPDEQSEVVVIPGRPETDFRPGAYDPATADSFETTKRRLTERLRSGGGDRPPRDPETGFFGPEEPPPPTEACAYYVSFRFGARAVIYVGIECWFSIAKFLHDNGIPPDVAVDEAFMKLFRHEYFHFEIDKATAIYERACGLSSGRFVDHWRPYHSRNNPSLLEEALANANAYKNAGKGHPALQEKIRELVAHWMSRQPAGYRDFASVNAKRGDLGLNRSKLLSDILSVHQGSGSWVRGLEALVRADSFAKPTQDCFKVRFEDRPIPIYFF